MKVGSLFAGIGGIELGLERAGMETVWQVENDPFCTAVLAEHWPNVKRFGDVKDVGAHNLDRVDLICGGFPCQDISQAGKGAGIKEGTRSGLWFEYARVIRELRPSYVIVENVPALRSRGLNVVLGDLAACGYDAEWDCIPAQAIGAPHRRDRIWIVAYPESPGRGSGDSSGGRMARTDDGIREQQEVAGRLGIGGANVAYPARNAVLGEASTERPVGERARSSGESVSRVADSDSHPRGARWPSDADEGSGGWDADRGRVREDDMGQPELTRLEGHARNGDGTPGWAEPLGSTGSTGLRGGAEDLADAEEFAEWSRLRPDQQTRLWWGRSSYIGSTGDAWVVEPDVGRVAHGVPNRVDRLTALGNAVVPQVAEVIGWLILAAEGR